MTTREDFGVFITVLLAFVDMKLFSINDVILYFLQMALLLLFSVN